MEEAILRVENLSHRYSVQWAIRNISFEITRNGIYGLLGSNGAGKSTTMNIMCGVLKPTAGDVFIKGVSVSEEPIQAKRYIGFLPQKPPLHMDLTVEEYLAHCGGIRQMSRDEIARAINVVVEKCAIGHFRKRLIRNLSGGYQQRVGIAQAIMHNPAIVVLDEPTNGLDPNQIVEIRHLIKEIAEERTVIISTHILPEVQATCDYIRMIEQGSVVFSGTVEEFDNYLQPDTIIIACAHVASPEELMSVPGVLRVEELGGPRFRLQVTGLPDKLQEIVEISVTRNWGLSEIYPEKSSLDAVFAELSQK